MWVGVWDFHGCEESMLQLFYRRKPFGFLLFVHVLACSSVHLSCHVSP